MKLVSTRDLKSLGLEPCRFESYHPHQIEEIIMGLLSNIFGSDIPDKLDVYVQTAIKKVEAEENN